MQRVLDVVMEVAPKNVDVLTGLIEGLRSTEEDGGGPDKYGRLRARVPVLHFLSMSVFRSGDYDPLFVIEANFDGPPGPFLGQLEAVIGEDLRAMIRCCKPPLERTRPMFEAVAAPGSRAPVAPYLEARAGRPDHPPRGEPRVVPR